ncbi:MAG: SH3 domain-containing protein [Proteobacteria bacterium]|nr:SH3 domain-containing protein [Pseudomonadota bacterium]
MIIFLNMLFLMSGLNAECIIKNDVELRNAPNKHAAVTWKVRKYFPVKKLKETNYWMRVVDLEGDKHWVQKMYLTNKYHCVIVKVSESRLKKEPDSKSEVKYKESALKYETFRFVSAKKGWIQIKDVYGDIGWIPYEDVWMD